MPYAHVQVHRREDYIQVEVKNGSSRSRGDKPNSTKVRFREDQYNKITTITRRTRSNTTLMVRCSHIGGDRSDDIVAIANRVTGNCPDDIRLCNPSIDKECLESLEREFDDLDIDGDNIIKGHTVHA